METVNRMFEEFRRARYPDGLPRFDDETGERAKCTAEFRQWCEQLPLEVQEKMKDEWVERIIRESVDEVHKEMVAAGKVRCAGVRFEDGEFVELWRGVKRDA